MFRECLGKHMEEKVIGIYQIHIKHTWFCKISDRKKYVDQMQMIYLGEMPCMFVLLLFFS